MKLEDKKQVVAELAEKFAKTRVVIVTDYKGLDVITMNSLRRKLREADIEYKVVKNSLLSLASEGTEVEPIKDFFKGPNAIAMSYDDPVAPAKVLSEFAAAHKKLEIKAGVLRGKLLNVADIKALADLPSREVLLGLVLSTMNGVPTAFVRVLNDNIARLLNVLQAIKDQKGGDETGDETLEAA